MYHHQAQSQQRTQRFSWQPVSEGDAPTYQEIQQQQHAQRNPADTVAQQAHVSAGSDAHNRHFSYAQTPIEHEAFFYVASPTDPPMPSLPAAPISPIQTVQSPYTPIDPRPQSTFNPLAAYSQPSVSHDSNAVTVSPVSPDPGFKSHQQAAQPPKVVIPPSNHARKMSELSPINTNVGQTPIPPMPPISAHHAPGTATSPDSLMKKTTPRANRQSYANEPYSPHGFASNQTGNFHAVFSPDAAHGPNGLDFALHQPGQIAHPNMDSSKSPRWMHSLCSCSPEFSTCFTGLFCPCILYGRTSYRLSQKSAKRDPTDMLGHSSTNGHCMMMGVSCGFWWLFPMLQRTRIRHIYKLEGSLVGDLLKGCCCCCCVAVQNEREVKSREEASRRWAGPASTDAYTRSPGMVYKPQR